jgi:fructose-1,6-bisphosphatase II / sedoheptulose-1,7-bisphosphatase
MTGKMVKASHVLDRVLVLEMVRVTEAAAVAASHLIGRGDEKAADAAAVAAMRAALNTLEIDGTVVIGEGERDEAPMLYIGEKVGAAQDGGPRIDIALDPLEGTTITAKAGANAMAVLADRRAWLPAERARRLYGEARGRSGLSRRNHRPSEERHREYPRRRRRQGRGAVGDHHLRARPAAPREIDRRAARARLRHPADPDGDVAGVIAVTDPDTSIDIYMGSGGAPEGVLAAAALRCVGGQFQGRLLFRNDDERARAARWGVEDLNRIYRLEDLAKGDAIFAATGVTNGSLLDGVQRRKDKITTESVVMRASTGTVRWVRGEHRPDHEPGGR